MVENEEVVDDLYGSPDDYSDEERITEAPSSGVYIAGTVVVGVIGMFFGIPPFLLF